MATVVRKFQDLTAIKSKDVSQNLNFLYIIRPNETLAVDKDSIILLEDLYYLLDSDNAYYDSGWFYNAIGEAALNEKTSGKHLFFSAVSGLADAPVTWVETMRTGLSANGAKVVSIEKNDFEEWNPGAVVQIGQSGFLFEDGASVTMGHNAYFDGVWKYTGADEASRLYQQNGSLIFEGADLGVQDGLIAWKDAFSVDKDGNVNIEGNLLVGGSFDVSNFETISANTTITLEKTDKTRTILLTGAIAQLTINKGVDVNESNTAKIINNASGNVIITDGLNPSAMEPGDISVFFFSGTTLYRETKRFETLAASGTVVVDKYAEMVFIDVTSTATILTLDLTDAKDNVKIFVRNNTAGEITVKDAITTNTFYHKTLEAADYGNGAGVLLKTSPAINYNSGIINEKDYNVFPIAAFSASGTFSMVPGQYFNFINITGSGVTVTIDRTGISGANRYLFVVRNISSGTVYVADTGQTIELKASNSFIFRLRGTNTLEFVTPRTSYTGVVDPRDLFNGFLEGETITDNTIFDALAPFIPNIGDPINLFGSIFSTSVLTITYAKRITATLIEIYGMRATGVRNTLAIDDGSGATWASVSISW